MRTFRIRSTIAAIAAAIPLSIGLNAHAEGQDSRSQSSAATSQPSAYSTEYSGQRDQSQAGQQQAQGQYGQAMAQGGHELVGKDLYGAQGAPVSPSPPAGGEGARA